MRKLNKDIKDIIDILLEKSRENKANWLPSSDLDIPIVSEDDFSISMPNQTLNVFKSADSEEIFFAILDAKGDPIFTYNTGESDEYDDQFSELYFLAKHKASNIDSILAEIKIKLEGDDEIGYKKISNISGDND